MDRPRPAGFVPLPILDRNQGNIRRAEINVGRTRDELTAIERQVITEVQIAAAEYHGTREELRELEQEILPIVLSKRNAALERFRAGELTPSEYLNALNEHGGTLHQYRALLVRHRRSMLDLNTAVGCRVLP